MFDTHHRVVALIRLTMRKTLWSSTAAVRSIYQARRAQRVAEVSNQLVGSLYKHHFVGQKYDEKELVFLDVAYLGKHPSVSSVNSG